LERQQSTISGQSQGGREPYAAGISLTRVGLAGEASLCWIVSCGDVIDNVVKRVAVREKVLGRGTMDKRWSFADRYKHGCCATRSPRNADAAAASGPMWEKLSPATSPLSRAEASMDFDAATGNDVMFGGTDGTIQANTWTWNGVTWR
jgi:hypothetical protein